MRQFLSVIAQLLGKQGGSVLMLLAATSLQAGISTLERPATPVTRERISGRLQGSTWFACWH